MAKFTARPDTPVPSEKVTINSLPSRYRLVAVLTDSATVRRRARRTSGRAPALTVGPGYEPVERDAHIRQNLAHGSLPAASPCLLRRLGCGGVQEDPGHRQQPPGAIEDPAARRDEVGGAGEHRELVLGQASQVSHGPAS